MGTIYEEDKGEIVSIKGGTNLIGIKIHGEEGEYILGKSGIRKLKTNKKNMLKKIGNYVKKMVDPETQALLKAGLINGNLEPTTEGMAELNSILFFANKDALIVRAKEIIAEAEAEENK